uniref:Uncharacterized protein n=1 Tax=Chromera velia CCMP2878 TaxID=1169474 RepID=A0A0G4HFG2_9ALVE|eukprot:Cvel_6625.t1-p1 / transcript=Cvel_6625.t1 / gene=Cvel_6625 / organism=Chromera_velia_CCMP2878 / gene_product=hypothetical protein / transcript_product=hypothetical protein / location=Cvel_scaffold328:38522-40072(+) / protein_length=176 / sequence_SO=supercontig / SO=protein_coding / is_pseudo=false
MSSSITTKTPPSLQLAQYCRSILRRYPVEKQKEIIDDIESVFKMTGAQKFQGCTCTKVKNDGLMKKIEAELKTFESIPETVVQAIVNYLKVTIRERKIFEGCKVLPPQDDNETSEGFMYKLCFWMDRGNTSGNVEFTMLVVGASFKKLRNAAEVDFEEPVWKEVPVKMIHKKGWFG